MEFKDRLREARVVSGKTQKAAAELCGMVYSTYQQYEIGRRIATCENVIPLSRMFNVSTDWLIGLSSCKTRDITMLSDTGCEQTLVAELSSRLRIARINAGLTQKQVGNALGWADDSGYRKYEAGKYMPTIDLLAQMADVMNVSTDWLLGLSSDPAIYSRIPLETKNEE